MKWMGFGLVLMLAGGLPAFAQDGSEVPPVPAPAGEEVAVAEEVAAPEEARQLRPSRFSSRTSPASAIASIHKLAIVREVRILPSGKITRSESPPWLSVRASRKRVSSPRAGMARSAIATAAAGRAHRALEAGVFFTYITLPYRY